MLNDLKRITGSLKFLILFLLNISFLFLTASEGYRIEIRVDGLGDSVCYLANYYGDKTYLKDTAYLQPEGNYVFAGVDPLPGGIYIVAGQKNNKYFEVIVDKSQHFTVHAKIPDIPESMKFTDSPENSLFYDYIVQNVKIRKEIEALKKRQDLFPDSANDLNEEVELLYDSLSMFETQLIKENKDSFVAALLKARQDPKLPEVRYLDDGTLDSIYQYQIYKNHYWDNLDPTDERLLRTPLYHTRLKRYFEQIVYQHPDTIIREADAFIARVRDNRETFKYAVWYLTFTYETSNVMGFDEIFVHMVDHYYAQGLAYWADSSIVAGLMKRADELKPVLIGNQAPNMILLDTTGSFISLYSIEAPFVLILFYEYSCSHCRKEIQTLKEWYPKNPFDLEIFAVCTDTSLVQWKKYIDDEKLPWIHANATRSVTPDYHKLYNISVTPTIYLLDERKKIIAKRLKSEQLAPFMESYVNREKNKEIDASKIGPNSTTN